MACPVTGNIFTTKFDADSNILELISLLDLWIGCPECGSAHPPTPGNTLMDRPGALSRFSGTVSRGHRH
jgi:hypothetical protein